MKKKTVKRGLYIRTETIPETWDEVRQNYKQMASALDTYIESAERYASEIVREAGIDPETLFDRVETETGGRYSRHIRIDHDALDPEIDYALRVLISIHHIRPQLNEKRVRDGMIQGIRLTENIEHLNATLAFGHDIEKRRDVIRTNRKSAKKPRTRKLPSRSDLQAEYRELVELCGGDGKRARSILYNKHSYATRQAVYKRLGLRVSNKGTT